MAVTSAGWARPRTETWSVVPGAASAGGTKPMAMGRLRRGREAAAGDLADRGAGRIEDLGAFAGGRAFDEEADADAAEAGRRTRARMRSAPGKSRGFAAALADGEVEAGFDGRDGLVEVVAVERQAGFEAEGVAGAEADGLYAVVGERARPRGRRRGVGSTRISKPSSPV